MTSTEAGASTSSDEEGEDERDDGPGIPKIRLGAVSFLNTRPLTVGLDGPDSPFELRYELPSRCAADLAAGSIDVVLFDDFLRELRADAVNVLKRDDNALVRRDVDASNTGHVSTP